MKVTSKEISETKVELTILVDGETLQAIKQKTLQRLAKKVKAPGFRAGKAPLGVVEKQLDASTLESEVIQEAMNTNYQQAVTDQKLKVLNSPDVTITKFVPYESMEFKAVVSILPKIKLGDYKKIKKTLPKVSVTAKDIAEVIDNLRERSSEKKSVSRAAKNGDEVIIDFEGTDKKGKLVAGASGKDYPLTLGSNSFIPGFEEGIVGLKSGDDKDLNLTFPKDYHAASLAGSSVVFKTTVKSVNELAAPEANDEFAKQVGPFETLKDLEKDVKQQLLEQKTSEAENKLKDEIVEELVKKSKLTLPEILVSDQITMLEQDFSQNLLYRGITLVEYLKQEGFKDAEEWKDKELKPQSERRVSVGIVLAEVAEAENIKISDQELADRITMYKQQYGKQASEFDQPDMQREVASRLITEKTVNRLLELATTK